MYEQAKKIQSIIDSAERIVVIQADNPDGDSLASALALEEVLGDMGKEVALYCGVDMPTHLTYLPGWDRVSRELPKQFDASIIVDNGSDTLLEKLQITGQKAWVKAKPIIVIDHHTTEATIDYASVLLAEKAVATGEVLYELAQQLKWPLTARARNMLATSIMSDSLGLVSEGTSPRSIHIIAELVESGVKLAALDTARRDMMRKSPALQRYKGELLQRIEYFGDNNEIATVTIPWQEIETYSPFYNPSMLVIDDMRLTEGTAVAIAFKVYKDGKVTAKIRCNYGHAIGNELAEYFGGGGHPYASGFKITDKQNFEDIKKGTVAKAQELLAKLEQDETL